MTILSVQGCPSVFTDLVFHVVLKLFDPATIHCGQELIDQSFRGVNDVLWAWERATFDIVDIVPETIDSLYLDRLLHLVEVSILFCVSRIGRRMTAEDVFGEHELNVAAAACTN